MSKNAKLHEIEIYKRCAKEPFKEHKIVIYIIEKPDGSRDLFPINYCDDAHQCDICENCKNDLENEYRQKLYQLVLDPSIKSTAFNSDDM